MRLNLNGTYRQREDVQITALTNGRYDLQVEGRPYPYSGVGATWLDADNSIGEDVVAAFVQGSPQLPIMFSRGSKPTAFGVFANPFVAKFTGWPRRGEAAGGYFEDELDDPSDMDSSVIMEGEVPETKQSGSIVRTYNGVRVIADGDNLREESEATGETIVGPTDMGGEIVNMHVDTAGNIRSIVYTLDVVVDCDDAYNEAYELAQADADNLAFGLGQDGCDDFPGDFPSALAAKLVIYLNDPARAIPSEWSTCTTEYQNGLTDGWEAPFTEGWEDRGCS